MTRGNSMRSKSPRRKRRTNECNDNAKNGKNKNNKNGGLRTPDIDAVSMLSNEACCKMENGEMKRDSQTSTSSTSSIATVSMVGQQNKVEALPPTIASGNNSQNSKKPQIKNLRNKENYLSLESEIPARHVSASSSSKNKSKRKTKRISKESSHHSSGNRHSPRKPISGLPMIEQQQNEEIEEAAADSGSSGDCIILPAITVPKNYDSNQHQTLAPTLNQGPSDEIVRICIDSPSEEEASFMSPTPTPPIDHNEAGTKV